MNLLQSSKMAAPKAIAVGADSLVDCAAAAGDESSIMSPQESDVPAKPEAKPVAAPANRQNWLKTGQLAFFPEIRRTARASPVANFATGKRYFAVAAFRERVQKERAFQASSPKTSGRSSGTGPFFYRKYFI